MSQRSDRHPHGVERAKVGLISLGAGLAVAGVGAAIGVAAERASLGRPLLPFSRTPSDGEDYGGLRTGARVVEADDGTCLHVEIEEPPGQGRGHRDDEPVTLVFSHGYALSLDSWHFQRKALREIPGRRIAGTRFRMVFWDQRGHGRSQAGPPNGATIDQIGADLARVIDEVAPTGPLVLIGHSMGGMTVMSLAAHHPEVFDDRVLGVALVSTTAGGIDDVDLGLARLGKVVVRLAPHTVKALSRTPRLVEQARRLGSDLEAVLVKRYSYASPVSAALVDFTTEMIAATRLDVISDFLPAFPLHDKREALATIDGRELLVIVGDQDLLTPADHSSYIVARLPGAEHVVVRDGGHLLMLEHPDAVNRHLLALIERAIRARPHRSGRDGAGVRRLAGRLIARARPGGRVGGRPEDPGGGGST